MAVKYKKGSAWKRAKWDKWSRWRKAGHIVAVILSLLIVCAMVVCATTVVLGVFIMNEVLMDFRDMFLLEIMHRIFD